jgi:hypothetical protein
MGLKLIYIFDELPGRPVDPGYGVPHPGFPVDPGYGVPAPPARPDQGLPPGIWPIPHPPRPDQGLPGAGGERPDHGLPPGVQLPIYIPPDGRPAHPIFPVLPSLPNRPTKPVPPDAPDQGLPGSGEHPDQGLPEPAGVHPDQLPTRSGGFVLIWIPGMGYVAFPLPGGKVDNELPDAPAPEPQ